MCLEDRVLVYGDCAVIPRPTAEQLADIAISSAQTAEMFDIEPRVAMLSYSTGESGHGSDVEKVRQATQLVRQRAPDLIVDGPIQYDAAVDPTGGPAEDARQHGGGTSDRVRLSRSEHRQQHLQGRATNGRRRGDRSGAAGTQQTGQRSESRLYRHRRGQHGRHYGHPGAAESLAVRGKRTRCIAAGFCRSCGVPFRQAGWQIGAAVPIIVETSMARGNSARFATTRRHASRRSSMRSTTTTRTSQTLVCVGPVLISPSSG